jgi:hypothetical protein
MTTYL